MSAPFSPNKSKHDGDHTAWRWVPSLYFAEGVPYVIVMTIAVIMYQRLGLSNEESAFYTSLLYLPWVIKPFWSPVIDVFRTKRWWIIAMQFVVSLSILGVAFALRLPHSIALSLVFFWVMAFSSATHDIAADGYYMLQLSPHGQSLFVGIRSTFYRIATIAMAGLIVMLAGLMENYTREPSKAWSYTIGATGVMFLCVFLYHRFRLPRPQSDVSRKASLASQLSTLGIAFAAFFTKRNMFVALAFMLLYRLPEALLSKICPLFMLDVPSHGGLGLTTSELGLVQGTVGVIGLILGGILGGIAAANGGFKKWLWPMVMSISLPNVVYIFLAYVQSANILLVSGCVFIEQFGYGFGFTAYMLFLLYYSQQPSKVEAYNKWELKTAHYAFCTGFMALSMMLPGMFAGWLQETVGYLSFFIIVMLLVSLTFLVASHVKVSSIFGRKSEDVETEASGEETGCNKWLQRLTALIFLVSLAGIVFVFCTKPGAIVKETDNTLTETIVQANVEQEVETQENLKPQEVTEEETEVVPPLEDMPQETNAEEPLTESTPILADRTIRGDFGNGLIRKEKLGRRYREVQDQVNEKLLN